MRMVYMTISHSNIGENMTEKKLMEYIKKNGEEINELHHQIETLEKEKKALQEHNKHLKKLLDEEEDAINNIAILYSEIHDEYIELNKKYRKLSRENK